jgi:hypothetical protein
MTILRRNDRGVVFDKQEISRNAETDQWSQMAGSFLMLAEREMSAFVSAVDELFGAEQARQSAADWIEELELMDWPTGESIPNWRQVTLGASVRLSALRCGKFGKGLRKVGN